MSAWTFGQIRTRLADAAHGNPWTTTGALTCPDAPGLAVHPNPHAAGWDVTHVPSGCRVLADVPTLAAATRACAALVAACDWTREGPVVQDDPVAVGAVRAQMAAAAGGQAGAGRAEAA